MRGGGGSTTTRATISSGRPPKNQSSAGCAVGDQRVARILVAGDRRRDRPSRQARRAAAGSRDGLVERLLPSGRRRNTRPRHSASSPALPTTLCRVAGETDGDVRQRALQLGQDVAPQIDIARVFRRQVNRDDQRLAQLGQRPLIGGGNELRRSSVTSIDVLTCVARARTSAPRRRRTPAERTSLVRSGTPGCSHTAASAAKPPIAATMPEHETDRQQSLLEGAQRLRQRQPRNPSRARPAGPASAKSSTQEPIVKASVTIAAVAALSEIAAANSAMAPTSRP